MKDKINRFLAAIFADSDVNKLLMLLVLAGGFIWLFIGELAPFLVAVLIAYMLDGAVTRLTRLFRLRHTTTVSLVVFGTLVLALLSFSILPKLLVQIRRLTDRLPELAKVLESMVSYANRFIPDQAAINQQTIVNRFASVFAAGSEGLINGFLSFAGDLFSLLIYLVLIPLLVFFMLKEKMEIRAYVGQFLPASPFFVRLWDDINEQFGSYIRGKFLEAVMVGTVTWYVFLFYNMDFSLALAVMVGLSVFVPFVGIIVVTFPVVILVYLQFGWSADFAWIIGLYTFIQVLDAQLLVPLLFSQVVKISPVALFASIIFFGNLWGAWGVFLAIPMASLIKCLISATLLKHPAVAFPPPPPPSPPPNPDS